MNSKVLNPSRKIVVIVNPAACRGRNGSKVSMLHDALEMAARRAIEQGIHVSWSVLQTKCPGESIRTGQLVPGSGSALARAAAEDGAEIVAAAGGDGTVGDVVNGLVGSNAIAAVIPMGTGNDLARALGIGTSVTNGIDAIIFGSPRRIDLGKIGCGYFVNIAGCGFDAEVARRVNYGFQRLRGTAAYLAAVAQTLAQFKPADVQIEIDGKRFEHTAMLCAVANATSYGGGMRVAPEAKLDDGAFDIIVVGDVTPLEFLRAFPRVFKGTHLSHPKVYAYRGTKVTVRSSTALPVLADGEEIGSTPVEFGIVPAGIDFMVPNHVRTGLET
ncbi:MAG: diacylglycerol kinase family lipid kinase [Fimbriimonas sp.]|nr:diacylglycerol kinase family lipid kinase [Fimbriimonas sp.]